jgi:hypothetical protein
MSLALRLAFKRCRMRYHVLVCVFESALAQRRCVSVDLLFLSPNKTVTNVRHGSLAEEGCQLK